MRGKNVVVGEQLAQVDNRDPFAAPGVSRKRPGPTSHRARNQVC